MVYSYILQKVQITCSPVVANNSSFSCHLKTSASITPHSGQPDGDTISTDTVENYSLSAAVATSANSWGSQKTPCSSPWHCVIPLGGQSACRSANRNSLIGSLSSYPSSCCSGGCPLARMCQRPQLSAIPRIDSSKSFPCASCCTFARACQTSVAKNPINFYQSERDFFSLTSPSPHTDIKVGRLGRTMDTTKSGTIQSRASDDSSCPFLITRDGQRCSHFQSRLFFLPPFRSLIFVAFLLLVPYSPHFHTTPSFSTDPRRSSALPSLKFVSAIPWFPPTPSETLVASASVAKDYATASRDKLMGYDFPSIPSFPALIPDGAEPFSRLQDIDIAHTPTKIISGAQRLRGSTQINVRSASTEYYDYIVVGCGAAGCPVARTLADGGYDVLVIERGSKRSKERTPAAMDIYGAGIAVGDQSISQLVVTEQGVRSHIGTVMGGGTAINMAIYIREKDEFLDFLEETFPGVKWDRQLVQKSYDWIGARTANPMPEVTPYGSAWRQGLARAGYPPNNGYNFDGTPNLTYSDVLGNGSWGGMSLFNSSESFARKSADVLLSDGDSPYSSPSTLTIKTEHFVTRVEFDRSGRTPVATCVYYRPALPEDSKTIRGESFTVFGLPVVSWSAWLENIFSPVHALKNVFNFYNPPRWEEKRKACIKGPEGEIILSAGAILTPTILYKSGVGPREQLRELEVDPVLEIPTLGTNISDRVLIPVGFFLKEPLPLEGFEPRICQSIGARPFGPDCQDYTIGGRTLKCSMTTAEELSGGHIPEQVIYSTRFIFPPEFRNKPLIEYIFSVLTDCASGHVPFGNIIMKPLCTVVAPIIECFRRVAANFYFTSEPKSRGSIHLNKDGSMRINANYMKDTQDLFDAVRGVSNIINIVNSDVYKGIIEPIGRHSCPVMILNCLLDVILQASHSARPFVAEDPVVFSAIQQHLEDLIPEDSRRLRRLVIEEDLIELDDDEVVKHGFPRPVRVVSSSSNSTRSTCEAQVLENYTKTCADSSDIFGFAASHPSALGFLFPPDEGNNDTMDATRSEDPLMNIEGYTARRDAWFHGRWQYKMSPYQWAATYPPTLPDPSRPDEVARYVFSYMTSIWHWSASAAMGDVVDSNFRVNGLERISIVDMSILNQVTRMNPTAFAMMMGRYAGLLKLRERGHDITAMLDS